MPRLCQLHRGITIHMYYGDHLPPHFHAKGRGWMIRVNIATKSIMTISGQPPSGTEQDLLGFATAREMELALCWTRCQAA